MKKIFMLLLALFLLTGCTPAGDSPTDPSESIQIPEPTVDTTEPPVLSFYLADSAMERGTGGAIQVYEIADATITGISRLGDHLVVCADGSQLYLLDHKTLEVLAQRELGCRISWDDPSLVIHGNRMAYYDAKTKTYTILDENLQTVSAVSVEGLTDLAPIISDQMDAIFLADAEGIRCLNLATGTARLLRQENKTIRSLDGTLFDGTMLRYTRMLPDGTRQQCFIDAQSGRLYSTEEFSGQMETWGDHYVTILALRHPLGSTNYLLTGSLEGPNYMMSQTGNWDRVSFPGDGLVVLQTENPVGLSLNVCDLNTGVVLSQVTMPQIYTSFPNSCVDGDRIWIWDGTLGRFYCWNTDATATNVQTGMLELHSTLEFADEDGLLRCIQRAAALSKTYGVDLSLTEGSNRTENVDYSGYADYRPGFYMSAINRLESALKKLPAGFLETLASETQSGRIQIELVDDYDPAIGILDGTGDCDLSDGGITLRISMCEDIEAIFYHELFHAMESSILSTCDDLHHWDRLNPEGFAYGPDNSREHIRPGSNYFADEHALTSPREDRAQIFMYAMMDDNGGLFSSDAMQAKLAELCRLIRMIYQLDDSAALPWEQYLNQ